MEGAMYAFPQVHFSKKFQKHAKKEGKNADTLYCMELLESTGIMVVPGSGFG
jgi:aspartate/methionine/tyrosine aminotransferase